LARTRQAGRAARTASVAELFAAATRHHRAGQLAEADRLYRQIRTLDAAHAASFHLGGVVAHRLGRADALDLIARAVALAPGTAAAHHDLGAVLASRGRTAEAIACFERAIALEPAHAEAYDNLGGALGQMGRFAEAEVIFEQALAANPRRAMTHVCFGNMLRAQGRLEDAATQYARAADCDPRLAVASYNLATVLKEQRRFDQAVTHYRRALALVPHSAEGHNNLGLALNELGKLDEAVAHFREALRLRPEFAGAHNNLANALNGLGRPAEAAVHYDRAISLDPKLVPALYNRGVLYRAESRFDEALKCFEQALTARPDFIEAKFARCMTRLPILYADEGEIPRRRAEYATDLAAVQTDIARAERPGAFFDMVGAHQPFYLAYQGMIDRDLQVTYGAIVCRVAADRFAAAALPPPPGPDEPLRVGIVSGFFRHHSNWKVPIKGWLRELDRRKFRIYGYYTDAARDDETSTAAALCERFVSGPLPIEQWRSAILEDAPHVLIYPEIGMDPMSARLAAQRLAMVQCASWGHPDTSGLPSLDYYLSSELMEPADGDEHYVERLVRLPNLSIHYDPPKILPTRLARAELGFGEDATVFWCGQAIYKYLPQFDQIFPRIAREVKDSQFAFVVFPGAPHVTDLFRQRLDRAFGAFGLDAAEHCVMLPRLEPQAFVAAMGASDIMLDSIGWSGCNSTLESLVHDLPIVTFTGPLMRGRHTFAILSLMDVTETIAATIDDYVALAARLAHDRPWRAAVKARIARSKHRIYRDRACIAGLEAFLIEAVHRAGATSPV
jgi:predicted O-linked N-acetylglucosamine transferase (SPINDLY family)